MTDISRIEELQRRVDADPASIAFAQLAEEYRRAGQLREAVDVCRTGLARHPGYLSARVTLARALFALDDLDPAEHELMTVLKSAPDNLTAVRGLGDIDYKRGAHREALACFEAALTLVRSDPELESMVARLKRLVSVPVPLVPRPPSISPEKSRALRTIAALENWLTAVSTHRAHHVARTQPGA